MTEPFDYSTLSDLELAKHFMPRLAVPDHERWLSGDLSLTRSTKERLHPRADCRYGKGQRQVADLYPAPASEAPLFVFFHGGYWRALSKDHVGFIAEPLARAGIASVFPNYDLCPDVSLEAIVEQAKEAVAFAISQASILNANPRRLYVGGNSAGAHLAAMLLAAEFNAPSKHSPPILGAFLVTGIYDLRAILRVQVNEDVRLSDGEALRLSPQFLEFPEKSKFVVSVGAREPSLWIDQSRRFAAALATKGHRVDFLVLPRLHHFSITRSLADPNAPLCRALLEFIR
jgi:arylformamidase